MVIALLFQQILYSNSTKYKQIPRIGIHYLKNPSHWCTQSQLTYRQISDYHTYCSQKQHLRFLKSKDKTALFFCCIFCTLQSFLPSQYGRFPRLCDSLLSNSIQLQTLKRQLQKTKWQRNMGQDQQLKQLIQMNFRLSNPAGRNSHTPLSFP